MAAPKQNKVVVNMRFDPPLLAKVDAAARRKGLTRTAWLHWVGEEALARGAGGALGAVGEGAV